MSWSHSEVYIGQKFGKLTVTSEQKHVPGFVYRMADCRCDCGKDKQVAASHLLSGRIKSCGCLKYSLDGLSNTPEYRTWQGMMSRCNKTNNKMYNDYGGRGIIVCDRWKNYKNFLDDMGEKPTPEHSIERVDNNKGYCPENVIWATREVQINNTRKNIFFEYQGKTQTLAQWCHELKLPYTTIRRRITLGWSIDNAFTEPIVNKSAEKTLTFNGVTGNLAELAKAFGVNDVTLSKRLLRGWTLEEALTIKDGRVKKRESAKAVS